MTPEHEGLVRASWRRFEPFAKDWALVFYRRLFELHPGSRALFSGADMPVLQHKFRHMLGWMVQSLGNPERLVSEVARLGRRHQAYGVRDSAIRARAPQFCGRWSRRSGTSGRRSYRPPGPKPFSCSPG